MYRSPDRLEALSFAVVWPYLLSGFALVYVAVVLAVKTGVVASVEKAVEMRFRQWEVRFTSLHERRVEVTGEMQERLVALSLALERAVSPQLNSEPPEGLHKFLAVIEAFREARRYLAIRRYLLPTETADKIEELVAELGNLLTAGGGPPFSADGTFDFKVFRAAVSEGHSNAKERLQSLIDDVEREFRKLGGI